MEPTYEDMYANPTLCPRYSQVPIFQDILLFFQRISELQNTTAYIQFEQKMQPLMQQFMQALNSTGPFTWGGKDYIKKIKK
jgi:hypothetical protein